MKQIKGVLIYPPTQLMEIETPRPDGSLGLLYLASSLESKGIKTDLLDASVGAKEHSLKNTFYRSVRQENGLTRIGMNFEEIADYVAKGEYDFVGMSSNFTPQTNMIFETAKAIKQTSPNVKIYAGGVNARALKDKFLQSGHFEGICLTEGELIFPDAILNGVENVPGFAYLDKSGKIKINPVNKSCFPAHLDDLTMPAWEKLPFDKYEKVASPHGVDVTGKNGRYAPIMTSRGCPFSCIYCHVSNEKSDESQTGNIGKLRFHSIDRIVREIETLKDMGVKKLFFEDDSLFSNKKRAEEIFSRVKKYGMSIADVNGVNLINFYNIKDGKYEIDFKFLDTLKSAGFDQLVFPVESASPRILKKYASGKVNPEKMNLPKLMKAISQVGIQAPVNIMIGFPDETEEELNKSVELGKKLFDSGAPYVTFFIPIPFPGSKLYDIAASEGYLQSNFNTDILNWKHPVMQNTTIPPLKLEELRDNADKLVNKRDFIELRLEQSVGHRWKSK